MVRKSRHYKGGYDDNSDGVLNTSSSAKQGLTHHIGNLVSNVHSAIKDFLFNPKEDEEKSSSAIIAPASTSQQLGGKRKRKTRGHKLHKKKTRKHNKSKRHSRRHRR